jgi:hypothetical protein
MERMNKDLTGEMRKAGLSLCDSAILEMKNVNDIPGAVKFFFANIDYCLNNNFPPKEYFQKFDSIQQYGVYADEQVTAVNPENIITFGDCRGSIKYGGYAVGKAYIKHGSRLNIEASGQAFVMIDIFDNAEIEVSAAENAKIVVNEYGGKIIITMNSGNRGQIKAVKKHSKTY